MNYQQFKLQNCPSYKFFFFYHVRLAFQTFKFDVFVCRSSWSTSKTWERVGGRFVWHWHRPSQWKINGRVQVLSVGSPAGARCGLLGSSPTTAAHAHGTLRWESWDCVVICLPSRHQRDLEAPTWCSWRHGIYRDHSPMMTRARGPLVIVTNDSQEERERLEMINPLCSDLSLCEHRPRT